MSTHNLPSLHGRIVIKVAAGTAPVGLMGLTRKGDPKQILIELFGGWKTAQKEHFEDGGLYDQIVATAKR